MVCGDLVDSGIAQHVARPALGPSTKRAVCSMEDRAQDFADSYSPTLRSLLVLLTKALSVCFKVQSSRADALTG